MNDLEKLNTEKAAAPMSKERMDEIYETLGDVSGELCYINNKRMEAAYDTAIEELQVEIARLQAIEANLLGK